MNELPLYILMALSRMDNCTAQIAFETAMANMELQRGGEWRFDHVSAIAEIQRDYENAFATAEEYRKLL